MISTQPNKLSFDILQDGNSANVTLVKDGISSIKTVSIEDIISKLASNYKFSTGLIPKNTRLFSGSNDKYTIVLETEPRVRTIAVKREGVWDNKIPFPTCLFVFDIKEELIRSSYLFSLKNYVTSTENDLYCFPLGNVYIEDGRICWGNVVLPKITKPGDLISVINLFFDSRFNGDLADGFVQQKNISGFMDLIEHLDGKPMFPEDLLKKRSENISAMLKRIGDRNEET